MRFDDEPLSCYSSTFLRNYNTEVLVVTSSHETTNLGEIAPVKIKKESDKHLQCYHIVYPVDELNHWHLS